MTRFAFLAILTSILCATVEGQVQRTARRARLPTFSSAEADEFFADVFARLVGERPGGVEAVLPEPAPSSPTSGPSSSPAWSKLISPTTIEDEVKAIKRSIDASVTTQTEFARKEPELVRREYSVAAALFGIIHEYDGDVRWKQSAPAARQIFAQAAAPATSADSGELFREAQLRAQDLEELLRGSSLNREVKAVEQPWNGLNRSHLMRRLETAYDGRLSTWTAEPPAFAARAEMLVHEAEMTAALAEALLRPGMEDSDDETYAALARRMRDSAQEIVAASGAGDQPRAQRAAGQLFNVCTECHGAYRG